MSLIQDIEARMLALGASDIEIRQTGTGGSALKVSFILLGERQSHVWRIPNNGRARKVPR